MEFSHINLITVDKSFIICYLLESRVPNSLLFKLTNRLLITKKRFQNKPFQSAFNLQNTFYSLISSMKIKPVCFFFTEWIYPLSLKLNPFREEKTLNNNRLPQRLCISRSQKLSEDWSLSCIDGIDYHCSGNQIFRVVRTLLYQLLMSEIVIVLLLATLYRITLSIEVSFIFLLIF